MVTNIRNPIAKSDLKGIVHVLFLSVLYIETQHFYGYSLVMIR